MSWSWLGRFWRAVKLVYLFLLPARFGFLAVAILGFAFLMSEQGADILRALVEYDPTKGLQPHYLRMLGFVLTTNACALQIWYWTRQILRVKPPARLEEDDYFAVQPPPDRFPRVARWIPRLLGVLLYVVPILAFLRIRGSYKTALPAGAAAAKPVQVPTAVGWMLFWLGLSLAAFLVFVVLRRAFLGRQGATLAQLEPREFARMTKGVLVVTILAALAFFVWATLHPVGLAPLGSGSLVLLTTALWVPIGTVLVMIGVRLRFPILSALFVWALLVSPWADRNHIVRTVPPAGGAGAGGSAWNDTRPDAVEQLEAWYARVAPRHAGGEVPVFVVATEGGGIRAAYWTASALTAVQDRFPCFADHLFAISSVSGGSLGGAVFEALLAHKAAQGLPEPVDCAPVDVSTLPEEATLRNAAKEMLSFDALTPTLAALTQPDLAQRFLPVGFPDRERALERSWERGWSKAMKGDELFAQGVLATIQAQPRLPSLFINGTMVETGDRIVSSNCRIHPRSGKEGLDLARTPREDDLPLAAFRNAYDGFSSLRSDVPFSSAAGLSARFSYVSPAGRIPKPGSGDAAEGHVVDGGYFENSGAVTASEVVDLIRRVSALHPDWQPLRPYVILIAFEDYGKLCERHPDRCGPDPTLKPFPVFPGPGGPRVAQSEMFANEILSPLRALLNTRGARGSQAVGDIRHELATKTGEPPRVLEFRLIQRRIPLPLGWLLSERSRIEIDGAVDREGGNRWAMATIGQALGAGATSLAPDPVAKKAAESEAALAAEGQ